MLIVAGHLLVDRGQRDLFVADCVKVVQAARTAPGCLDFSIAADIVDPEKVCIFERWDNERDLLAFRGSGPSDGQQAPIIGSDVRRYVIASVGEA